MVPLSLLPLPSAYLSCFQNQAPDSLHGTAVWNRTGREARPAHRSKCCPCGAPNHSFPDQGAFTSPRCHRSFSCYNKHCLIYFLQEGARHSKQTPGFHGIRHMCLRSIKGGTDSSNPTMAPVVLNSTGQGGLQRPGSPRLSFQNDHFSNNNQLQLAEPWHFYRNSEGQEGAPASPQRVRWNFREDEAELQSR